MKRQFFCRDQKDQDTEIFETLEEAVNEACTLGMAPFTVFEMLPYPVAHRLTNAIKAKPDDSQREDRRTA